MAAWYARSMPLRQGPVQLRHQFREGFRVFMLDRARHHGPTSRREQVVKPESAGTDGNVVLHRLGPIDSEISSGLQTSLTLCR